MAVASARRSVKDSGMIGPRPRLVRRLNNEGVPLFDHRVVQVVQEIKGSSFVEGKLANIRLGAQRLDGVVLAPGETLSFWKLVGRPTAAAGFAMGRTIRGGVVSGELGGGLCQLSGIVYEAGLRAGLDPVERHPHSRDLYAEADRFTPLGLDATVVWPYRDLRLANALAIPVQFSFLVESASITAFVLAPEPLVPATLEIERADGDGERAVSVTRRRARGEAERVSDDIYLVRPAQPA
jgi:vancomycin resistance protein VanW